MKTSKALGLSLIFAFILGMQISAATAATFTLIDKNSSVSIDPESQAGVYEWLVDGTNHMYQQWFWYRVGNVAEQSIDTLPLDVAGTFDPDFDGNDNGFFVRYQQPGVNSFRVEVLYTLLGGEFGSGTSDLAEQIRITNTGRSVLNMTFFQYADFDLNSTSTDDTVISNNANSVTQSDPFLMVAETVITPVPNRREVNLFANTLTKLNDGLPTDLDNNSGPVFGDATWAFQWNLSLPVNTTFIISKDKHLQVVPEPTSVALMGLGLVGLVPVLRRRYRGR